MQDYLNITQNQRLEFLIDFKIFQVNLQKKKAIRSLINFCLAYNILYEFEEVFQQLGCQLVTITKSVLWLKRNFQLR